MLNICKSIFESFNESNIEYCSFKSNEHLEEGLNGDTDLDILLNEEQYNKVVSILRKNKFIQFEPDKIGKYPNVVNWYGYDIFTGKLVHIHLHFKLMTGKGLVKEYELPWEKIFLKNFITDKKSKVKILSPEYEYVLLCTRSVVKRMFDYNIKRKKEMISNDIKVELQYLLERIDEDKLKNTIIELYGNDVAKNWFSFFKNILILDSKNYYKFSKLIRKFLKNNTRYNSLYSIYKSLYNKINRRMTIKINNRMNKCLPLKKRCINKGLRIAFVGIDGSGKSTVSSLIRKWLGEEVDTIKFYCGSGEGKKNFISAFLLEIYKKLKMANKKKKIFSKNNKELENNKSYIKAIGASIAYVKILKDNIEKLRKSEKLKNKGVICIMDRYPQNSLKGYHDGAKLYKYEQRKNFLINYYIKKETKMLSMIKDYPYDILFKMIVSPEISYNRKPEESLESLKIKADKLKQVTYDTKKVIEIDANLPLDIVVLKVKEIIWNELFAN